MTVRELLRDRHVSHEAILHNPSPTAAHLAQSVHVTGGRVAKAVLVRVDGRLALAVLPATHRIELDRLAQILKAGEASIATEDELELAFPDCERGSIPPFGSLYGLPTIVDASLSGGSEILIEGNVRHEGFRVRYRDFEAIEGPIRARFATPIAPRRKRNSHRRAG